MSPQPSREIPREASALGDDLVFGDDHGSSLAIPKALIAQIWTQVNEGMRTLTRGGLEVGGLLVGPKTDGGPVVVDEVIPLPIEYRRGPSFQMSPSDLAGIAPAVESVQADPSKAVVGLYRSRTRGEGTLRESDQEIFDAVERAHTSFAADFQCCFVLVPMSQSLALACIAMRSGEGWDEMPPVALRSDPLSIIDLPSSTALQQMRRSFQAEVHAIDSRVPSGVQALAERRVSEELAAPGPATRWVAPRARMWLYAAGLVAVAIAVTGAYGWAFKKQPPPAPKVRVEVDPARAHLGFSAAREGPAWKLSWDRAAMDALNPVGAVLAIEDGGLQQQIPLEPADLASGIIFYTPQSGELTFSLRIDRGGTHVEEHVRVLDATRSPQKPPDRFPQSVASRTLVPARVDSRGTTQPAPAGGASPTVPAPANPNASSSLPAVTTTKEPASASATQGEGKSAPAQAPTPAPAPLPQPPVVALALPVLPPVQPRSNTEVLPSPTPAVQQAATKAPPATGRGSTPEGAGTAAASPGPGVTQTAAAPVPIPAAATPPVQLKTNYVGPRPTRQVSPQVAGNRPSGVSQVEVLVEIDPRGKVTKVTPVGWTVTNAPLMISATRAASSWVFEPAQLNGHAVSSQMNLIFRF